MDQSLEQWRPVAGYEGLYEVSDAGRVRSVDGERWNGQITHKFTGRILKQATSAYKQVTLSKNKKLKTYRVHQLVADAFLPPCPGLRGRRAGCYQVDHINNNRFDNRACNLQWLTVRDNTYTKNPNALAKRLGSNHPNAVLNEQQVAELKNSTEGAGVLAQRYKVSKGTIQDIRSGRIWKHVA